MREFDGMDDETRKILEEQFKAGEFYAVTILVKAKDLNTFIEHLKKANLTLAVIPKAQAAMDFEDDEDKGTLQ